MRRGCGAIDIGSMNAQFKTDAGASVMVRRLFKCAVLAALLSPLGGCMQGMPDPVGWVRTYPQMCLPGFHGVPSPSGGYHCDPNAN